MSPDIESSASAFIKDRARILGFDLVGIAAADDPALQEDINRYHMWIEKGYGASMDYLSRHEAIKADPRLFLEGARSVISIGMIYGTDSQRAGPEQAQVSIYTRGLDYHDILGGKLRALSADIEAAFPGQKCRSYVDSSPVLDRFWAWRAGLGWLGKNTCLINRKAGSFVFLGGVMTTLQLVVDAPQSDHCGRCTSCIQACPTGALREPHVLDGNLCIAYHTIENRAIVPESVAEKTGQWVAGCDLCQTACPWNDPVTPAGDEFQTVNQVYGQGLRSLIELDEAGFKKNVKGVAMGRMKFASFLRNLAIAVSNSGMGTEEKKRAYETLNGRLQGKDPQEPSSQGLSSALEWARGRL